MFQGSSTGRIFQYSLETKIVKKVIDNLSLANGVQLSRDEKTLLVVESTSYRMCFFDINTWKKKYMLHFPGKINY